MIILIAAILFTIGFAVLTAFVLIDDEVLDGFKDAMNEDMDRFGWKR